MTGRGGASSSRRLHRQEEQMVRRRNAEADRAQLWNGVTTYFRDWSVRNAKNDDWTSQEYYDNIAAARLKAKEEEKEQRDLDERRLELVKLLSEENERYERELLALDPRKPMRGVSDVEIREMDAYTYEFKRREEEARQREAELRLDHHWRINEPVLRNYARNQHASFVRDAWVLQVEDKHKEMEEREKKEIEAARTRELEVAEEEKKEKEMEEARKLRAIDLREQIVHQISELREKEQQAEQLKLEEAEDMRKQAEIEDIFQQRRLAEKQRVGLEHSSFLNRQYQLRLRRRAREVQEELAQDQLTLERLIRAEARDRQERDEKRVLARMEMEAAREMLAEQAEREREVEREAQFIFHEEAQRMWAKQEARWNAERDARARLMADVLLGLQQQIEQRLQCNLAEQGRLLSERENLLGEVEEANRRLREEQEGEERAKEERRKEREKEIAEKKMTELEVLRERHLETQRNIVKEREKEEKILRELRRMEATGYQPQNVGRRILW